MLACRQAWWYMQDTSSRYDLHNVQSHTQPQSINQSANKSSIIIIFSTLVSSLLRQIYLYIFYSNYLISLCNIYVWHHDVQTCTPKLILLVWHKTTIIQPHLMSRWLNLTIYLGGCLTRVMVSCSLLSLMEWTHRWSNCGHSACVWNQALNQVRCKINNYLGA